MSSALPRSRLSTVGEAVVGRKVSRAFVVFQPAGLNRGRLLCSAGVVAEAANHSRRSSDSKKYRWQFIKYNALDHLLQGFMSFVRRRELI
jgi:hypothetical protein